MRCNNECLLSLLQLLLSLSLLSLLPLLLLLQLRLLTLQLLNWWIVCWMFSWLDELVVGSTDDVFLLARLRSRLVRCKECIAFVSAGCAALQHRTSAQNESACDESCCNECTSCMSLPT